MPDASQRSSPHPPALSHPQGPGGPPGDVPPATRPPGLFFNKPRFKSSTVRYNRNKAAMQPAIASLCGSCTVSEYSCPVVQIIGIYRYLKEPTTDSYFLCSPQGDDEIELYDLMLSDGNYKVIIYIYFT